MPGPITPERDGITLADWREPGHGVWSFHHVREIVPSADIPACPGDPLEPDRPRALGPIPVPGGPAGERPLSDLLASVGTKGVVALRGGRIAGEWYGLGYDGEVPHILFSISKSFTALLAGCLAGRGLLDPDAPVTAYVPEVAGSAYAGATLRHVLDMTVSTGFEESYLDTSGDYARYRVSTAWNPAPDPATAPTLRSFLAGMRPGDGPHGAAHHYCSPHSDLLGWVCERAGGAPFAELFAAHLWQPLGAETAAYVTLDLEGAARSAGGICATPRDLARLGEMVRLGGIAQGRPVVPSWWIDDIWTGGTREVWAMGDHVDLFPQGRYRSKWYVPDLGRPVLVAIGIHSQWLWIEPEREIVIALVSARDLPSGDDTDQEIIAALGALCEALA